MSEAMHKDQGERLRATGYSQSRSSDALPAQAAGRAPLALSNDSEMIAIADASRRLADLARRVAVSDCTVLIAGESGTGKEILARFIHRNSSRSTKPFIAVNCAAIPENMLEAILFGYERGAFTGAHASHPGKFEQAQGGTVLLDEVTEMPLGLQAKLLRVLQEREVERLGGRVPIALDVRVLATTNRDLRGEVAANRFREDLYYRLNVFPLTTLPLRERRDDVLPLAMKLLTSRCRAGERIPALSADAAHLLLTYPWPGNVRELDNVMQRALILAHGPVVEREHIQLECAGQSPLTRAARDLSRKGRGDFRSANGDGGLRSQDGGPSSQAADEQEDVAAGTPTQAASRTPHALSDSVSAAEHDLILEALRADNGNRQAVAKRLGISPRTLRYKLARMREAGVEIGDRRTADGGRRTVII
jgi:two-component system response regulator FlrC